MQNWLLFPDNNTPKQLSQEESIEMLLFLLGQDQRKIVTKDEWRSFVPECKAKCQEKTLGFFCGDMPENMDRKLDLCEGIPPVELRPFQPDLLPGNAALEYAKTITQISCCKMPEKYSYRLVDHPVITVAGMLHREKGILVHGSKVTRFSKYKIK
jgi:hypothetical protein